jgi:hypothetical protein
LPQGGPNRILEETHGWPELAKTVAALDAPVLGDAHQTIAQILFYEPEVETAQWPGISRPSEFVRRPAWNPFTVEDLRASGGFWLLIGQPRPPRLEGFHATGGAAICNCVNQPLQRIEFARDANFVEPCADGNVHTWYLVRYAPD